MDPMEKEIRFVRGTGKARTGFALWLARERITRRYGSGKKEWTADDVRRRIKDLRGYTLAHSTYATLESGAREPSQELYALLTEFFGSTPMPDPEPSPAGDSDLTAAVRELAEEVRLSRLAQERTAQVLVDLVGLVARGTLTRSEIEAASGALDQSGK